MLIATLMRPDRTYRTGVIDPFYGQGVHPVENAQAVANSFLPHSALARQQYSQNQGQYNRPSNIVGPTALQPPAVKATVAAAKAVANGKSVTVRDHRTGTKATVKPGAPVKGSGPAGMIARIAQGVAAKIRGAYANRSATSQRVAAQPGFQTKGSAAAALMPGTSVSVPMMLPTQSIVGIAARQQFQHRVTAARPAGIPTGAISPIHGMPVPGARQVTPQTGRRLPPTFAKMMTARR